MHLSVIQTRCLIRLARTAGHLLQEEQMGRRRDGAVTVILGIEVVWYPWPMHNLCYRRHRFPVEIIQHAAWPYFRFPLSFRDAEDLLAERTSMFRMRLCGAGR